jgi:hypothetical protein
VVKAGEPEMVVVLGELELKLGAVLKFSSSCEGRAEV